MAIDNSPIDVSKQAGASRKTAAAPTRYSDAELARILKWQSSHERLRGLYWKRVHETPWKNRGHSGASHAWGDLPDRSTWHVVHDVPVAGGTVLRSGVIVPKVGGVLHNVPLARACSSRGQGRKMLKRLKQRFPDARLVCVKRVMSDRSAAMMIPDRQVSAVSISANEGAPLGWWNVRAEQNGGGMR